MSVIKKLVINWGLICLTFGLVRGKMGFGKFIFLHVFLLSLAIFIHRLDFLFFPNLFLYIRNQALFDINCVHQYLVKVIFFQIILDNL